MIGKEQDNSDSLRGKRTLSEMKTKLVPYNPNYDSKPGVECQAMTPRRHTSFFFQLYQILQ